MLQLIYPDTEFELMYNIIVLLIFFLSYCSLASNDIKVDLSKYKSYSYSLIDEIKIAAPAKIANKTLNSHKIAHRNSLIKPSKQAQALTGVANQHVIGDFSAKFYSSVKKSADGNLNSSSVYVDYELAPGIFPYIETRQIKGRGSIDNKYYNYQKRANLFLIGTKIEF